MQTELSLTLQSINMSRAETFPTGAQSESAAAFERSHGIAAPIIAKSATAESLAARIVDMETTAAGLHEVEAAQSLVAEAAYLRGEFLPKFGITIDQVEQRTT